MERWIQGYIYICLLVLTISTTSVILIIREAQQMKIKSYRHSMSTLLGEYQWRWFAANLMEPPHQRGRWG